MIKKIEYLIQATIIVGTLTGIIPTLVCAVIFNIVGI